MNKRNNSNLIISVLYERWTSTLIENLKSALIYGIRLNKPVVPYVWYLIHPSNKKFGNQIIGKEEMKLYLNTIKNYCYLDKKAQGIIWWEPKDTFYNISEEMKNDRKNILTKDEIFIEYTDLFQK